MVTGMPIEASEFEKDLYTNMPITQHMGVKARVISNDGVVLWAPIAPNKNHNQTAFGGCVYSVAVLSCWALANETVRQARIPTGYIVVQDAEIDYQLPVSGDFEAKSSWLAKEDRERFILMLKRRGLARASLAAVVTSDGIVQANLTARFVAQIKRN